MGSDAGARTGPWHVRTMEGLDATVAGCERDCDGKQQTQRRVQQTVEHGEAGAAKPLEEPDVCELADCTSEKACCEPIVALGENADRQSHSQQA